MEPAKIDWNRIHSRFVEDYVYEHINAPKWVDFLTLDHHSIDDDAWFCTPDCNHPKTAEDFLQASPLSKAPRRSVTGGGNRCSPFRELNQGDAKLKRRGQTRIQSSVFSKIDNSENQNPNLSTPPPNQQAKSLKAAIKSSSERKKPMVTDDISQPQRPRLKKLATRARERETEETIQAEDAAVENERMPLVDLGQEKPVVMQKGIGIAKEKKKIKRGRCREHGLPLSLNLENVKSKDKEGLLQIRTNPPSPQCFSAPFKTTTPFKAPRSRVMERGILQEVKQSKDIKTDKLGSNVSNSIITNVDVTDGRQARALDVFWFLKPSHTV
ncbi:hypothetical protein like AT3G52110 [Hibiscus trionum]|uniref:Uncharacterized protein n=1 Tax=Hibiscus trionum TaxID=183268 RepID=A0A9W7MMA8_HIBTR|nr:hypothetical protein like AT3G52110 [Hibiscus trionum]